MTKRNYPPRIGNTERQRPALKYANPTGTCSRYGCEKQLRRAPKGYYGKFCNTCSRILVEHGDFNARTPSLKGARAGALGVIYQTALKIIKEATLNDETSMSSAAGAVERLERYSTHEKAGDPRYALANENWTYHHYLYHLAQVKGSTTEAAIHLTAVIAVTQLAPEKFASKDQRDLFTVKRGLGGNGLPALRVNETGEAIPHGRHSIRRARKLAKKLRADFKLERHMVSRVAEEAGAKLLQLSGKNTDGHAERPPAKSSL